MFVDRLFGVKHWSLDAEVRFRLVPTELCGDEPLDASFDGEVDEVDLSHDLACVHGANYRVLALKGFRDLVVWVRVVDMVHHDVRRVRRLGTLSRKDGDFKVRILIECFQDPWSNVSSCLIESQ